MKYNRDSKYLKLLGKRIKSIREDQEISQAQLAFESGVRINQIGRIERGEINTGISTLLAISEALDIQITELVNVKHKKK